MAVWPGRSDSLISRQFGFVVNVTNRLGLPCSATIAMASSNIRFMWRGPPMKVGARTTRLPALPASPLATASAAPP